MAWNASVNRSLQDNEDSVNLAWNFALRATSWNCPEFKAQKITEKLTFHSVGDFFHFLSAEFPFLSMEFLCLEHGISIF